jgi:hypothetical protein
MTAILPPDVVTDEFDNPERLQILIIEAVAAHVRKLCNDRSFRETCQYMVDFSDVPGTPVPPTRQEMMEPAEVIERVALVLREDYFCWCGEIEGLEW